MEGWGGWAHEERSWTCDSGGLLTGQLTVLLGASVKVSADFFVVAVIILKFKHSKVWWDLVFQNHIWSHSWKCSLCTVYTRCIYLIQLVECSSRLNDLLLKMEKQGYVNITYMVVNNREEQSQKLHHLLNERLINITLYAQDLSQPDVWQTVNAEKDDILVYDRFGSSLIQFNLPNEHYYLINMPLNTLFYQVWPTHLPSVSSLHHPEPPTCGGGYNTYLLWWYLWRVQHRGKTAAI